MEETDVKDPNLKQSLESATSQISQLALSNSPTGVANLAAVFLFPLFINYFQMGVTGAATATVVSQYIGSFLMIWFLSKRVILLPPKFGDLKFGVYLKSGGFLIGRTVAVLITMTIGTSMAARQGPLAMAAHQICMQVWLAVSLLTDGLAASGQVYTPRNAPILVRKLMCVLEDLEDLSRLLIGLITFWFCHGSPILRRQGRSGRTRLAVRSEPTLPATKKRPASSTEAPKPKRHFFKKMGTVDAAAKPSVPKPSTPPAEGEEVPPQVDTKRDFSAGVVANEVAAEQAEAADATTSSKEDKGKGKEVEAPTDNASTSPAASPIG
ncbi:uncharacterized protein [Spinacia oleracea]|uniref:Polysaccharide biosynthesis protein C-terminal domain-containing protein n=1 Tax=Spinacia oleracea TaxID=3562 RepID=A0ABM3RNY4_SPIOL|nr:uncharacterized protein LOC130471297 [Spinacia oleracea]